MPVINFNNRGVSHLQFAIGVSSTEIRIPWADFSQFINPQAIDGDTMWAVLRDPIVREIVKIDLANSNLNEATAFLKVERAQGGTTAQMWPAGTLIFLTTHADHYEILFQPDGTRQIDFNPNGVVSPLYRGEKILQYAGCGVRWWMSFDAVNPYWQLIAGEPCAGEEYIDPGWGFRVWIQTVAICMETHFDNSDWAAGDLNTSWDGTKWVSTSQAIDIDAIGAWAAGFRPSLLKFYVESVCERGSVRLYDTANNLIVDDQAVNNLYPNLGPNGNVYHTDFSNDLDISRLVVEGIFSDPDAITNIEFYTCPAPTVTTILSGPADGRIKGQDSSSWNTARNFSPGSLADDTVKPWITAFYWSPYYGVYRTFLFFDLTGILPGVEASEIWELELFYYGQFTTNQTRSVCVQESTANIPLTTNQFNAFTGPLFNENPVASKSGGRSLWLNDAGKAYVANLLGSGVAKFCLRNYTQDYLDVVPTGNGLFSHSMNDFNSGFPAELRFYGDFS